MKTANLLFVLVASLSHPAASLAQSAVGSGGEPSTAPAATATIKPGDAVQITVWRKPELSGEFFVSNDGSIAHPFYQEVRIAGMSAEAATQRVQSFLEQYETSPRVRVDPIYRVSVAGHVRTPKLYALRPEYTVFDAIDEAGGPTAQGRLNHVRVYRDGAVYRLDLSGANSAAVDMRIQSGDRVVVGRNLNVFRDIVRPTVSFAGSMASLYYLWDRRIRRR